MRKARDRVAEAIAIFEEDLAANRAMGEHGAMLIPRGARIMTYCNAGALATSGHGTALGVVRTSFEKDKTISVVACETRPYLQGARLTAWECVQEGIPCTLITDNMAGHLMATGQVDARHRRRRPHRGQRRHRKQDRHLHGRSAGAPARPARSTSPPRSPPSIATIPDGSAIVIEERPAQEVTGYRGVRWAPEGVKVRNPAFDVTPAELITAIICEKGVVLEPDFRKILPLLERAAPVTPS